MVVSHLSIDFNYNDVFQGIEKKHAKLQGNEKAVVARHEAGHAVVGTAVAILLSGQPHVEVVWVLFLNVSVSFLGKMYLVLIFFVFSRNSVYCHGPEVLWVLHIPLPPLKIDIFSLSMNYVVAWSLFWGVELQRKLFMPVVFQPVPLMI